MHKGLSAQKSKDKFGRVTGENTRSHIFTKSNIDEEITSILNRRA